jgi:hypothetical protein
MVRLLETLIRKPLQILFDPVVGVYTSMSEILTKYCVNHEGTCTVGIMRRSDFCQLLLGVRRFALKTTATGLEEVDTYQAVSTVASAWTSE